MVTMMLTAVSIMVFILSLSLPLDSLIYGWLFCFYSVLLKPAVRTAKILGRFENIKERWFDVATWSIFVCGFGLPNARMRRCDRNTNTVCRFNLKQYKNIPIKFRGDCAADDQCAGSFLYLCFHCIRSVDRGYRWRERTTKNDMSGWCDGTRGNALETGSALRCARSIQRWYGGGFYVNIYAFVTRQSHARYFIYWNVIETLFVSNIVSLAMIKLWPSMKKTMSNTIN